MKRILFLLSFCVVVFASCGERNVNKVNATLPVEQYEQKMNALPNMQLIDVRTTEEYSEGHLKNARNIDVNARDFNEQIASLNKKKPVFVYCKSGGRSSEAAAKMKEQGFAEIYNMDGGIMKWSAAGKPLEKGAAPRTSGMTMDDLAKEVATTTYVLVDYNAKWCGPCKKMNPILESVVEKKKDKLKLLKVDADENPILLNQKKIEGIPYLELYKDGQLVWKHEGYIEESQLLTETKL